MMNNFLSRHNWLRVIASNIKQTQLAIPFLRVIPLNRLDEQYEPVFIIGSGRSGNTLLRRFLISSEQIHIPPETYMLGKIISSADIYKRMQWSDLVLIALARFEYQPGFEVFNIESLREVACNLLDVKKENRSLALILHSFYQHSASKQNSKALLWGDKTPLNTFHLEQIKRVFPKARFIHVIRDGCDVASSYVEAGLYDTYESAAKRWLTSTTLADQFSRRNMQRTITVSYEALVSDPVSTCESLYKFIGLTFDEKYITTKYCGAMGDVEAYSHHSRVNLPVDSSRVGNGRMKMSKQDLVSLSPILDKQLVKFGYSVCMS